MKVRIEDIIDYLEGKLSVDEKTFFEKNMEKSVDFKKQVEDIAFIWRTSKELEMHRKINTERSWEEVSRKIKKEKIRINIFRIIRSSAAMLLFPVLLFTAVLYNRLDYLNNQQIAQLEVTSAFGTVSRATLPDGSEVWLNSGSMLTYPQQFTGDRRVVYLSGEAYFKVASDRLNRFDVVVSDELVVSAYGTEFNINSYKEDNTVDVTLVCGNIDVTDIKTKGTFEVSPEQSLTYNRIDKKMSVSQTNLAVKTGWKDGKMIFRRANMTEVTQRLSRHFNVDIRLEGEELYSYEYSATFTTETLSEILQLLQRTAPIQYKIIEPKQSEDYSFSKKTVVISLEK